MLAQITILTGGMKYAVYQKKENHPLTISHFVVFFLTWIVIEGMHQRYKRQEQPLLESQIIITKMEFEQRVRGGEQLVTLDDLVLDVSSFKYNHPGGKFVVEYNIGRDISKFFYGGYS
jgi:cytochrome b involved in lipid metabolism